MSIWSITDKLSFLAEWFDQESLLTRKFALSWYPLDETVELIDLKLKRVFLKRVKVEKLQFDDIFVGNSVTIFSRQFKIVDYANAYTKRIMGITQQKVFVMIKPPFLKHKAKIFQAFIEKGFKICKLKMFNMTSDQVEVFGNEKRPEGSGDSNVLKGVLKTGPVMAMLITGENVLERIPEIVGPDDVMTARKDAPLSFSALYGTETEGNAVLTIMMPKEIDRVESVIFKKPLAERISEMSTALLEHSTCCIVKPHVIRAGHFGDIVQMIEDNTYVITAMEMFYLDRINAEEFLEVYNGVVPEFPDMVEELVSGGCIALEISGPFKEENAVEFRKLVGPTDPEIARQLRPNTMRAKFGVDKIQNALHVTDLPEDALLEVEYFFRIMQL